MLKVVTLIPLLEFLACKLKLQTDLVTNEKILSLPKVTGNLKNQQNLGRKKKFGYPWVLCIGFEPEVLRGVFGYKIPRLRYSSRNLFKEFE